MKKVFRLKDLDCANCAAKMERNIARLPGVENVTVNFMTQKLTLEAADETFDQLIEEAQKAICRVDPNCLIIR